MKLTNIAAAAWIMLDPYPSSIINKKISTKLSQPQELNDVSHGRVHSVIRRFQSYYSVAGPEKSLDISREARRRFTNQ